MSSKLRIHGLRTVQRGNILAMLAVGLPVIIGLAGYAINRDRRNAVCTDLQQIVNSAALAGAASLYDHQYSTADNNDIDVVSTVRLYSAKNAGGGGGGINDYNQLSGDVVAEAPTITPFQSSNQNIKVKYQSAASGYNVIRVTQRARVPFYLIPGSTTCVATATGAAGGKQGRAPINAMIILDISGSMSQSGGSCGTKLNCAKAGARTLVSEITGRADNVGLMVFPPMNSTTGVNEQIDCTARNVQCTDLKNYMAGPPTQRWADSTAYNSFSTIVPLTSALDFAPNRTINPTHNLTKALGYTSGCGLEPPRQSSCGTNSQCLCTYPWSSTQYVYHTSLAQAIKQAQSSLAALSTVNEQKNAIIILSDGDANATSMSELTALNTGKTFAAFTGKIDNGKTGSSLNNGTALCVTALDYGGITIGQTIESTGSSTNVSSGTTITAFGAPAGVVAGGCSVSSAGTGGTGWYTVSKSQKVTSRSMRIVSTSSYIANQCQQAVVAANEAKTAGTTIYSVGYGIASGGCGQDSSNLSPINYPNITACSVMQWISGSTASNSPPASSGPLPYFFKDTSSLSSCRSTNDTGSLEEVFKDLSETFGSRLIPDDETL